MNESSSDRNNESAAFPEIVDLINNALLEKKATGIKVLDVRKLTTLTDFFVVCTGNSDTQIKALTNNVTQKVKEQSGEHVWRKEGLEGKKWVVLDYVDVVVHIFNEETRRYYGLETMWNDAKITQIEDI